MTYIDEILSMVQESATEVGEGDVVLELTPAQETAAFIDFITDAFTATEAIDILSNAEELAMHGLIHDVQPAYEALERLAGEFGCDVANVATEARKVVVVDDWKKTNFDRQTYRNAMMLALQNNDPNAQKAKKYKGLYIEYRNKVYQKWLSKAKKYTKDQMKANRNKASNMKSAGAKQITDKIDQVIKQTDAKGRNKNAIKK